MNMYVSNLGFHTSDDDLRKLFEAFGQVSSAKVITDRETGRSRGFGFVEMASSTEATAAMNKLNGKEIEGRMISVSVAR
jgi:RNA recognition motif-containing protein